MFRMGRLGDKTMSKRITIFWFRQDLRLLDNPALIDAAKHRNVLPIYIFDDVNSGEYCLGSASRWWLHHSLDSLKKSLEGNLSIYSGNPINILNNIICRFDVSKIYWNRCYEPWSIARDKQVKDHFVKKGIEVKTHNGSLLWEPWEIKKNDGSPYKVFTPFYRKGCLKAKPPRESLSKPLDINCLFDREKSLEIAGLNLLPNIRWDKNFESYWSVGEDGAHNQFEKFLNTGINNYKDGRNFPAKPYVSRLSPHLHFGEISPNQLWHTIRSMGDCNNIDHYCSELGWREFSYSQLYHNQELPTKNLQPKFDNFPWIDDEILLHAWQMGKTGIPMVDAGMRELWQTGYIHNRVRMIVGSFLVKNLRLHWRHGERWFWDTLIDADLANNSASWQWIAGCGADAAPYFRIFNPVVQGQRFDSEGVYLRRFIPEIASLPNKYLFSPWDAPDHVLQESGIVLGSTYPKPIVNLKESRVQALEAFKSLRNHMS